MKCSCSDSKVFRLFTFESCLHSLARTSQACLVVSPEPFDATCWERALRVLLQLPTRDQVLTAFVYVQNDRQHRRASIHFHPPSLLDPLHSVLVISVCPAPASCRNHGCARWRIFALHP